jgi:hypothetical protein
VIEAWAKQGFSLRHIMTEALLLLGKREANSTNQSDINETVNRLSKLVEKLECRLDVFQSDQPVKSKLSAPFLKDGCKTRP